MTEFQRRLELNIRESLRFAVGEVQDDAVAHMVAGVNVLNHPCAPAPQEHVALRPHEPTPEMLAAAMRADQDGMPASMKTIWMVMWSAYSPAALATTEGSNND